MTDKVYINDVTAQKLFEYIAKNMQTESSFLTPKPVTTIDVIDLLDAIAELRGIDKRENGINFNQICNQLGV